MTDLKVVQLRDTPLLNDIPGQLRAMADRIEAGELVADFALVVIDGDHVVPDLFGYGAALDTRSMLGMLDLAKDWFIRQLVADDDNSDENV